MRSGSGVSSWVVRWLPLAALAGGSLLPAATGPTALAGRVVDAEGRPVAGALVTARANGGALRHAAVTDDRGAFRLALPSAGRHLVALAASGVAAPERWVDAAGAPLEIRATPVAAAERLGASAEWLALLPNGERKRWFLLDCTGCHQLNETRAAKDGAPRSAEQWNADVERMHQRFGPASGFPILSGHLASADLGAWIVPALARPRSPLAHRAIDPHYTLTEYDLPGPDLPHDLAVDAAGRVLVTGMFTDRILVLDPATGATETVEIPIAGANPRAIEVGRDGAWWTLLGAAQRIARYEPAARRWTSAEVGFYGHSIALAGDGTAWTNDHFARQGPKLASVRPGVELSALTHEGPPFGSAVKGPSPIPYELRAASDGRIWLSLLHGNAVMAFDPASGTFDSFTLPDADAGPCRFDLDALGDLWIPGYTSSTLYHLDPRTRRFTRHPLPVPDALPYVVRVDPKSGDLWIGTAAADALFRFAPRSGSFATYPVPTRGATMRHLAIDPKNGDVWIAYGASPAIHPTRIARLRRERP